MHEDATLVQRLASDLEAFGLTIWLDRTGIEPGARWRDAIQKAIREGDFFVACFSRAFALRDRTHMNEELALAIEELRLRPSDRTWFIPVIIDDGEIPERSIAPGETLRDLQWVSLATDWKEGIERIGNVASQHGLRTPKTCPISTDSAIRVSGEIQGSENIILSSHYQVFRVPNIDASRRADAIADIWHHMLAAVDTTLDASINLAPLHGKCKRQSYDLLEATPFPKLAEGLELSAWESVQSEYARIMALLHFGNSATASIDDLDQSVARARLYISKQVISATRNITNRMRNIVASTAAAKLSQDSWSAIMEATKMMEQDVIAFEALLKDEIA